MLSHLQCLFCLVTVGAKAKVNNFYGSQLGNLYCLRVNVSMNNIRQVTMPNCSHYFFDKLAYLLLIKVLPWLSNEIKYLATFEMLHYQVEVLGVIVSFVVANNIRMVKSSENRNLLKNLSDVFLSELCLINDPNRHF